MASTATAPTLPYDFEDAWAIREQSFGPFANAGILSTTVPLFTVTEKMDVEKILIRMTTKGSAGTFRFWAAGTGVALASGAALTAAEDLNVTANNTTYELTLTNNTGLAPGTTIGFVGDGSVASVVGLTITIVTRKGNYRVTGSGEKFYPGPTSART